MIIVRPAKITDLNDLYKLSAKTKAGLTTFPHDKSILRPKIRESVQSFNMDKDKTAAERSFLFVMEDTAKKRVIGVCSVVSRVGGAYPFYVYQLKTTEKVSRKLRVRKKIKYLKLLVVQDGPAEIGTLFLDPAYRKHGNGRLLSFSRFLFMAQYKKHFKPTVIAELRGVIDKEARSPFWAAVGKHFFKVTFKKADLMCLKDKTFITDLVPRHPIYIPLLPISAQKVIGDVHDDTRPALSLLLKQGFKKINWIDIFEAGPVVQAKVKDIKIVKRSKCVFVKEIVSEELDTKPYMIAKVDKLKMFKVVQGGVQKVGSKGIRVSSKTAKVLGLKIGNRVRFAPLR